MSKHWCVHIKYTLMHYVQTLFQCCVFVIWNNLHESTHCNQFTLATITHLTCLVPVNKSTQYCTFISVLFFYSSSSFNGSESTTIYIKWLKYTQNNNYPDLQHSVKYLHISSFSYKTDIFLGFIKHMGKI